MAFDYHVVGNYNFVLLIKRKLVKAEIVSNKVGFQSTFENVHWQPTTTTSLVFN